MWAFLNCRICGYFTRLRGRQKNLAKSSYLVRLATPMVTIEASRNW